MNYVDLTSVIPADERRSSFLIDMSSVQLADIESSGNSTGWLHAMGIGDYKHPLWGTLHFTADKLKRFADNIANNVRGIDIAVDYGHANEDEAAGWVKDAEVRGNGLWLLIEWTKAAAEKIRNKEFRYFSPEFVDEWTDSNGKKFKDVLLGGGLTNRPFLKDLLPVNLSEFYGKETNKKEEESMEFKELLKALGLSEDASEEDALEAVKKLQEPPTLPPPSDDDEGIKKLAEENPHVKALMERVTELETSKRFSEAKQLVDSWGDNSKSDFAIPPAASEKLQEILVTAPKSFSEGLKEVMDHILDKGLVSLKEVGGRRPKEQSGDDESATKQFSERVAQLQKDNPEMSIADAYSEVSLDEELFARYREETTLGITTEEEVS